MQNPCRLPSNERHQSDRRAQLQNEMSVSEKMLLPNRDHVVGKDNKRTKQFSFGKGDIEFYQHHRCKRKAVDCPLRDPQSSSEIDADNHWKCSASTHRHWALSCTQPHVAARLRRDDIPAHIHYRTRFWYTRSQHWFIRTETDRKSADYSTIPTSDGFVAVVFL